MAKGKKKSSANTISEQRSMLCTNLNFAAAEAYKLLRTNLMFSLPDQKCRVIGVTSAVRNEGKSTTSVNLCYTLAETGKRVLLIEADMRLPNVAKRLKLNPTPGLSNLLVGLSTGNSVLQDSGIFANWKVVTAGEIPPNPSELLGSDQMRITIDTFSKGFDFIVIDLPPVNIVADGLVVSKLTDGIIMVVRKDYSYKQSVQEAVNQYKLSEAKLLGFVLTHVDTPGKSYSKYGKYGKYGRYGRYGKYGKYGAGYGYGYYGNANTGEKKEMSKEASGSSGD